MFSKTFSVALLAASSTFSLMAQAKPDTEPCNLNAQLGGVITSALDYYDRTRPASGQFAAQITAARSNMRAALTDGSATRRGLLTAAVGLAADMPGASPAVKRLGGDTIGLAGTDLDQLANQLMGKPATAAAPTDDQLCRFVKNGGFFKPAF